MVHLVAINCSSSGPLQSIARSWLIRALQLIAPHGSRSLGLVSEGCRHLRSGDPSRRAACLPRRRASWISAGCGTTVGSSAAAPRFVGAQQRFFKTGTATAESTGARGGSAWECSLNEAASCSWKIFIGGGIWAMTASAQRLKSTPSDMPVA
jgi:hypothetical protein